MSKESYLEIREDLKHMYSLINNLINKYELQKKNVVDSNNCLSSDEIISKLGDISSILQIDIYKLDMLFSINNFQSQTSYEIQ